MTRLLRYVKNEKELKESDLAFRVKRTAPSKTTDRLSSVSLLMSVESNSGAADARAAVTWPSAEVAARLNPFRTALLCSRASTRESSNWVTASWHRVLQAERSWVSSPRADGINLQGVFIPQYWPTLQTLSAASCPRNTCFGIWLSGMRIMWPTHRSCALSRKASMPIIPHYKTQTGRQTDRQTFRSIDVLRCLPVRWNKSPRTACRVNCLTEQMRFSRVLNSLTIDVFIQWWFPVYTAIRNDIMTMLIQYNHGVMTNCT